MTDESFEIDISSCDESEDSDRIDSDLEAEMYGIVHHDSNVDNDKNALNEAIPDENYSLDYDNVGDLQNKSSNPIKISSTNSNLKSLLQNTGFLETPHRSTNSPFTKSKIVSSVIKNIQRKTNSINDNYQTRTSPSDDSDSDSSVIFTGPEDVDLQLNLSNNEVILISSDDSEDSLSSTGHLAVISQTKIKNVLKNKKNSIDVNHSEHPWFINNDDLFRSKKAGHRYHERAQQTCSKCKGTGHNKMSCPVPNYQIRKCFLCGGNHHNNGCSLRVCYKCFHLDHKSMYCYKTHPDKCTHCKIMGHSFEDCPDLWRRYHMTTQKTNKLRKPKQLDKEEGIIRKRKMVNYCYNCGASGHYGLECKKMRMDGWSSFPNSPEIVSYALPTNTIRQERHKLNVVPSNVSEVQEGNILHPNHPLLTNKHDKKLLQRRQRNNLKRKRRELLKLKRRELTKETSGKKTKKKIEKLLRKSDKTLSRMMPKVSRDVYFPRTPKLEHDTKTEAEPNTKKRKAK